MCHADLGLGEAQHPDFLPNRLRRVAERSGRGKEANYVILFFLHLL